VNWNWRVTRSDWIWGGQVEFSGRFDIEITGRMQLGLFSWQVIKSDLLPRLSFKAGKKAICFRK
jgi:hypothetical protein